MSETLFNEQASGYYAQVILPLALPKLYSYHVPEHLSGEVTKGKRVSVQFGKSKLYSALVYNTSETAPEKYRSKDILEVLDDEPIVTETQLLLWDWMANYYMCTMGEIMIAALPSSLKLSSQTKIILNQGFENEKPDFNAKENLLIEVLQQQHELSINEVAGLLGQKTIMPLIKTLIEKRAIYVSEQMSAGYKPKLQALVQLHPIYSNQEKLKDLFELLERAPRQVDALMTYLRIDQKRTGIAKSELVKESGASHSVVNSLIEKEIFLEEYQEVSRLKQEDVDLLTGFDLSKAQETCFSEIKESFEEKDVTLLHGITSSGKTLIYIKLIEECISRGEQVLYLLPEIALTEQMTERLKKYFGNRLAVYHSKFNENERGEIWKRTLKNDYQIIMGARSALFLPFKKLGLVIVDEEHENSFKQYDPAPRYHARDTGIFLAGLHRAKTLLGTATPSIESYYNAKSNKYGLSVLTTRFGNALLPETEIVDMLRAMRTKNAHPNFSPTLLEAIKTAVSNKNQVILFKNRRGYVPITICTICGYVPQCLHCDISLTYHRSKEKLVCHYCGYSEKVLNACPACGSTHLEQKGLGTEKIEDELKLLMPDLRIARFDLDSTRSKNAFQQLLNDFEDHKIDVLVGTQMVTKGLDFGNVSLVGILDADSMFRHPDFRAFERSFQLMVQVSGRAGRRDARGKVLIQTFSAQHELLKKVIDNDYAAFYSTEITEREQFKYPPFYRLININLKHRNPETLQHAAQLFGKWLKEQLGNRVIGPQIPLIARIRNQYIQSILIKLDKKTDSVQKAKTVISNCTLSLKTNEKSKSVFVQVDVDPM